MKTAVQALEDQLAESMAKEISKEIDFEILSTLLCEIGWTKVVLRPMTAEHGAEIDAWVSEYVRGNVKTLGLVWLFEKSKDATMFILKWTS